MANNKNKKTHKEVTANPNIDWSKCDMQKFYDAWSMIIKHKYGVDIKYTVYKRSDLTPEQIEEMERDNEEKINRFLEKRQNG